MTTVQAQDYYHKSTLEDFIFDWSKAINGASKVQRRTLLKGIGTAATATAGLAGSASARPGVELDRELDVSDVSGVVPLADLLDEAERRQFGGVDPSGAKVVVAEETDTIVDLEDDCCKTYKHCDDDSDETNCTCACCVCAF